jgi:hypothetical protein
MHATYIFVYFSHNSLEFSANCEHTTFCVHAASVCLQLPSLYAGTNDNQNFDCHSYQHVCIQRHSWHLPVCSPVGHMPWATVIAPDHRKIPDYCELLDSSPGMRSTQASPRVDVAGGGTG